MTAPESFPHFRSLPTELRLKIWTIALTVPSVWTIDPIFQCEDLTTAQRVARLTCVGASPHLAGLSCAEARAEMKRLYKRSFVPGHPQLERKDRRAYWIHLDSAIIALTFPSDARAFAMSCPLSELARLRHIVLPRNPWGWDLSCPWSFEETCDELQRSRGALRTLIVKNLDSVMEEIVLNANRAAYYLRFTDSTGPEVGTTMDYHTSRTLIREGFDDPPPRIHILRPDSTGDSIACPSNRLRRSSI